MKKIKIFILIAFIFSSAFSVWFYYAPQRTLLKIKEAGEKGDTETLSELVDFPSFRQSIKDEYNAMMAQVMEKQSSNPFAVLGMMMATVLADSFVDSMVTPSSISAFASGSKPNKNLESTNNENINDNVNIEKVNNIERTDRYDGFSKYFIYFKNKEDKSESFTLVMRRRGLSWKLTAIRFHENTRE